MQQSGESNDGFADINITPFVDIVLVLLVIFMVTAKYMVSQSIPVDLPQASTSTGGQPTIISCSIDAKQQMYLDKTPMTPEQVKNALKVRRASDGSEVRAIVNADKSVPHGRVIELIDLIRSAGIEKFAIQTELPQSSSGS